MANQQQGKAIEENEKQPQLFVTEVLKMHARGELDEDTLDEQVITMLVGVRNNFFFFKSFRLLEYTFLGK